MVTKNLLRPYLLKHKHCFVEELFPFDFEQYILDSCQHPFIWGRGVGGDYRAWYNVTRI